MGKSIMNHIYDSSTYHTVNPSPIGQRDIDYEIGDEIVSAENPNKILGTCTGFRHDNTCIDINGKCYGGKYYFMKSEWAEFEIIE